MTLRLSLLLTICCSCAVLSAQYWYLNIITGELLSLREAGERFIEEGLLAVAIGSENDLLEQLPHALDAYGVDYEYHPRGLVVHTRELYQAWRLLQAGEDIQATLETLLLLDFLTGISPTQERVVGRFLRGGIAPAVVAGPSALWQLPAVQRGVEIEILRAGAYRLPHGFPVVDIFRHGVAISVKSIDIRLAAYQTSRLFSRLKGYVDKLIRFESTEWGGVGVVGNFAKELEIVIPKGCATAFQREIFDRIVTYGQSNNIVVKIIEL